jgi:hypothetical protein
MLEFDHPNRVGSPVLLQCSPARLFALGMVAALAAVIITAYAAAGVTAYVAQPLVAGRAQIILTAAEPQVSNRSVKSNRVALLLDSPSYTNFSSSFHALAFAGSTLNPRSGGSENGLLNEAQIVGIESRLRLTPRQAEYWPAVAAALRDVGHRFFQRRHPNQKVAQKVDVNSPEVQRLIETAMPLILQLSEDQKREVRQLVRIIGLHTVASQI